MSRRTHLWRRGAVYHFRIRVPADLVPFIGRKELRRSLATRDPREARRRCIRADHLALRLFSELRSMAEDELTEERIQAIVRAFYAEQLDQELELRRSLYRIVGDIVPGEMDEPIPLECDGRPSAVLHCLTTGRNGVAEQHAEDLIAAHGLPLDPEDTDHSTYRLLCHYVLRALRELNLRRDEHGRGVFHGVPGEPWLKAESAADPFPALAPRPPAGPRAATPRRTGRLALPISEALAEFLDERTGIAKKTRNDYLRTGEWFIATVGDRRIGDIDRAAVGRFCDALAKLPPNFPQRLGTSNPIEALKRAKGRDLGRMSATTINHKYLSALRCLFDWARERDPEHPDPMVGIRVKRHGGKQQKSKSRLAFSIDQLAQIFAVPLFTECRSERQVLLPGQYRRRDHYFWAPLLALFSGCRLNELGQLQVADIGPHHDWPHLFITSTDDPDDPDVPAELKKRLKTENARRIIPVHPELMRIGFLDYLDSVKASGSGRVFPAWRTGSDGYYSSLYSKFFNRTLLGGIGIKHRLLCFHSLRHNFKNALRDVGLDSEARRALMGHSVEDTHDEYGSRHLQPNEIEKFKRLAYPGLDLSRIRYR